MCGICGVIDYSNSPVPRSVLKNMTDAITHRGPDGEGFYSEKNIGLGHRRLAIIDLSSAGTQPMVSQNKNFVISYNGELYNYLELKSELEKFGHKFITKTDTEVILIAWQHWGQAAVEKFNGMFAFAIWDSLASNLFLVRDRYGIKPLYYGFFGNKFLFGSEQKAILANPYVSRNLDKKALFEYFTFQNIFTDRTLVEGIKVLPQGSILRLNANNITEAHMYQYWDFHFFENLNNQDEREYEEELVRLLNQAVSRQLMADVPLGSYLSGGMDSGTITALAARKISNLKTFTIGFDLSSVSGLEIAFDERRRAEAMSAIFRTEQYEMVLKSGDMERSLPFVTRAVEEPRVGQSYPNYFAAELASKFVKVILSGAGGDELFAGYPWRYFQSASANSFDEYVQVYYKYWQRLLNNSELKKVFAPIWGEVKDVSTKEIFRDVLKNHIGELDSPRDYINSSLYFEAKTFLHGLLVVEDKLSMQHSLESRVPFLDNDLVDFAMKLPIKLKLVNFSPSKRINENELMEKVKPSVTLEKDGKQILRKAMSHIIPVSITLGQKQGFSAPDASWFKGESIEYVNKILSNSKSPIFEYLNQAAVIELLKPHFNGTKNKRLLIWSILTVNESLKDF